MNNENDQQNINPMEEILTGLSDEEKVDILKKMGTVLYQRVLLRAFEVLSDKKKEELDKIIGDDSFSQETLLTFFKQEIPNFEDVITEETEKISTDFISLLNNKKMSESELDKSSKILKVKNGLNKYDDSLKKIVVGSKQKMEKVIEKQKQKEIDKVMSEIKKI